MSSVSKQVLDVKELAVKRLQRLSSTTRRPQESFVFRDDHLCGIRFRMGLFHAQWIYGEDLVEYFREGDLIDQDRLAEPRRRAA